MAFPTWTALTGVGGALLLFELRRRLVRPRPIASLGARRWEIDDVVWLLAIVALALVARLYNLEARPIDNDEPVGLGLRTLDEWAEDGDSRLHPPLPAILMTLAARGGIDLGAARGVSAIAGVLSVVLAFAIARRSGRSAAVATGVLVALAPAALMASSLARGWGLLACSLLLAHTCLTRALETANEKWWIAYAASVSAAILVEYVAVAPLAAEALVVAIALRRERDAPAATLGAFGAGLVACSFLVPFFLPTAGLGIGGPPHPPSGAWRGIQYGVELLSGAFPPIALIVTAAVAARAAFARRIGLSAARLLVSVLAILVLLAVGGAITAVRARYALHAAPLFFVAIGLIARPSAWIALFLAHAALLPCWFAQTCRRNDLDTRIATPAIDTRVRAERAVALAVVPAHAIGEPAWRIGRVVPGRDAIHACPATLCVRDANRTYYGVAADIREIRKLLEHEPRLFVLDRVEAFGGAPECRALIHEGGSTLYDCGRVR